MYLRLAVLSGLIGCAACTILDPDRAGPHPDVVRPSTGTVSGLREVSTATAATVGDDLDLAHDWLYRRMQHWLEGMDQKFASPGRAPIVVPLSPLRITLLTDVVHGKGGLQLVETPDVEATLRLPNLEQRLRLFVTSRDVQESPEDPAIERPTLRAGLRFVPAPHLDVEFGVRARVWPSAFASVRWTPEFMAGNAHVYPFIKPYVESGIGIGTSGGVAVDAWHDRWFVRSASYANWLRNESATGWQQSFVAGFARALIQERRFDRLVTGNDLACGVAARLSVAGDRFSRTTLYQAGLLVKRPLHGGWLYGYVEPLVNWNRVYDWHPDIGIRLGFDALFWGLSSLPAELASYCR